MSILVFCPSRGRPDALQEAATSLVSTRSLGDTRLMAILDADDPELDNYCRPEASYAWIIVENAGGMVAALNMGVKETMRQDRSTILGFIGDDHRFRTTGWDIAITHALKRPGYAYAFDGAWRQGEIPTQIFISRPIVQELGYFALPDCRHLYVDNAWRAIAEPVGALHYLPDLLIEHMHPFFGKAQSDEGYERVNSPEMYSHDGQAFDAWLHSPRYEDELRRVRQVVEGR